MHIKTFFKNLKKRASGSVETAIKVLTAVVLGAAILMGLYGLITGVVLPSTETAVNSMFAYSAEANGGNGGTEIPTPTPSTPQPGEIRTFTIRGVNCCQDAHEGNYCGGACGNTEYQTMVTHEVQYEYGMTWAQWIESDYNTLGCTAEDWEGNGNYIVATPNMMYLNNGNDSILITETIDETCDYNYYTGL